MKSLTWTKPSVTYDKFPMKKDNLTKIHWIHYWEISSCDSALEICHLSDILKFYRTKISFRTIRSIENQSLWILNKVRVQLWNRAKNIILSTNRRDNYMRSCFENFIKSFLTFSKDCILIEVRRQHREEYVR